MWDAGQYLRFGGERARPFFDLIAQVGAENPSQVTDLGCGPGNLTAALAARWPGAAVAGVDNSPEMIAAARASAAQPVAAQPAPAQHSAAQPVAAAPLASPPAPNLSFALGDVTSWRPEVPPDVIVSNAVLQWVPGHRELLPHWADWLAPGGWLAFQLPGNFDQPVHTIMRELAESPRWRGPLGGAELNRQAGDPADYVAVLARPGYQVDAWETSYLHILPGDDPVLEWTMGTALRPVLAALDGEQAAHFLAEYGERLREVYRPHPFGTILPFRRVFTVVHRTGAGPQ